ncbi:hypothetical protein H6G06_02155 [Anabaena sphaerica FACHB-251]|uniref:Uncharacterized protein n=1 Tax=Anabaena sphaerica FACHB-251 TaxID=2692883 RepID=A0A926ZY89_9NOST|nr:hypothetical protein [Anabaena sphaerica]MBD2292312.1 hypothetical protein [Anabaena sphaerica FACHB-251]
MLVKTLIAMPCLKIKGLDISRCVETGRYSILLAGKLLCIKNAQQQVKSQK